MASSARAMPALTRNPRLKDVSRIPRPMVSCLGEMSLQQGPEPISGCSAWGISQPMLKHKQEPPQQQLGGIKDRNYLLGWAAAVSFSPPARRRGGVRDGASCTPQRDNAVMGATTAMLEGQPGFAQAWLYGKKTDAPLPQHEDAWRHQEGTRRSWCCPTVFKGAFHPCSLQEQGGQSK